MSIRSFLRSRNIRFIKRKLPSLFDKEIVSIVLCDAIGDTVFVLGYLDEIKRKYCNKRIQIISSGKLQVIIECFSGKYDKLVIVPKKLLNKILNGDLIFENNDNIILCHVPSYFTGSYNIIARYPDFNMFKFIKSCILRIEQDAIPNYEILRSNISKPLKEPYVILCPEAKSLSGISREFWTDISNQLNKRGYNVFINTHKKSNIRSNEISFDLNELLAVADKAKAVIGIRSGVLDWLMLSEAPIIALYPDNRYYEFFDLKNIRNRKDVFQYTMDQINSDIIVEVVDGQ